MRGGIAVLFSDGSSRGNPGPGGWATVISYDGHVVELGGNEARTTNNRMEIMAALEGLKDIKRHAKDVREIVLYTDSRYLINGATKWIFGWQKNGWITSSKEPVLNKDLWEVLAEVLRGLSTREAQVKWNYVGGHVGIPGNERCDVIATSFADGVPVPLYNGKRSEYSLDLDTVIAHTGASNQKKDKKSRSSAKAYSYVSLVDGIFKTHTNWIDCEHEVKGKRGAKFQKTFSSDEESSIREVWQG